MSAQRIKQIENKYGSYGAKVFGSSECIADIHYLIARVKRLTEALEKFEEHMTEQDYENALGSKREALESDE